MKDYAGVPYFSPYIKLGAGRGVGNLAQYGFYTGEMQSKAQPIYNDTEFKITS